MTENPTRHDALWAAIRLAEIKGKDAFMHLDHSAFAEELLKVADHIHAWVAGPEPVAQPPAAPAPAPAVAAPVEVAEASPAS